MKNFLRRPRPLRTRVWPLTVILSSSVTSASEAAEASVGTRSIRESSSGIIFGRMKASIRLLVIGVGAHPSTGVGTRVAPVALQNTPMTFLSKPFHIGGVLIDPPLALAPMAEVTDTYYRSLVKELGGAGLVVSEFISAEGLTRDNARTKQMLAFSEAARPVAKQIYGGDPDRMDDA